MTTSGDPPTRPADIAEPYFACWDAGDPEPLRPFLHAEVTFDPRPMFA
ncbi:MULTISPECIES: hypothetical protein [unclassified Arthrobacter]|nr:MULTISPECIES: hypothetical protein [unclassified Arthrobacter]MCQ9165854.1 hypothetical protein [Arthrobacter sp. STN4]